MLKTEERAFVVEIKQRQPMLQTAQALTQEFRRLLQARDEAPFDQWLAAEENGITEFQNFAHGLRRDEATVRAATQSE